jgi:hypothetical protein
MKCPSCKHPMRGHADGGCHFVKKNGDFCPCCLEEGEVARLLLPKLETLVEKMTGVVMGVSDLRTSDRGRTYPTNSLCDEADEILKWLKQ